MTREEIKGLMNWLIQKHYKDLKKKLQDANEETQASIFSEIEKALKHREDLIKIGNHPACNGEEYEALITAYLAAQESLANRKRIAPQNRTTPSSSPTLFGSRSSSPVSSSETIQDNTTSLYDIFLKFW